MVTMGLTTELDESEPNSTPKLSLSKLPLSKARDEAARHMQTPPLRPSVSIPFHWEEAPGKPRAMVEMGGCKKGLGLELELPPRLMLVQEEASPRSVLEVGRSLSLACTFSFRKGVGVKSGRWGSERKYGNGSREVSVVRGYSQSLGDIFRSEDNHSHSHNVKMTRVRRRRKSFFSLSALNLKCNSKYLWGEIYASLKQAVPWRRSP